MFVICTIHHQVATGRFKTMSESVKKMFLIRLYIDSLRAQNPLTLSLGHNACRSFCSGKKLYGHNFSSFQTLIHNLLARVLQEGAR